MSFGLLPLRLCCPFCPKASCSAQSLWLSVTITLIETEFLKVISQVLYLTKMPTFFYIIWHFWQLPPTLTSRNNPHTHSCAPLKFSLPDFCRFLWNPSTTSVLFTLSSSHLSSYTSSETYGESHCGLPHQIQSSVPCIPLSPLIPLDCDLGISEPFLFSTPRPNPSPDATGPFPKMSPRLPLSPVHSLISSSSTGQEEWTS